MLAVLRPPNFFFPYRRSVWRIVEQRTCGTGKDSHLVWMEVNSAVRPRADPTWSACRAGLEASFSYHRARQRVACYFLQNGLLQPVADQLLISLNRSALCDYSSERSFVHLEFLTPYAKGRLLLLPTSNLSHAFVLFSVVFFFRNPKICV